MRANDSNAVSHRDVSAARSAVTYGRRAAVLQAAEEPDDGATASRK